MFVSSFIFYHARDYIDIAGSPANEAKGRAMKSAEAQGSLGANGNPTEVGRPMSAQPNENNPDR